MHSFTEEQCWHQSIQDNIGRQLVVIYVISSCHIKYSQYNSTDYANIEHNIFVWNRDRKFMQRELNDSTKKKTKTTKEHNFANLRHSG